MLELTEAWLLCNAEAGALSFVLPMINGSVGQLAGIEACAHGRSVVLDISLIARRSADRSGTRHWRRGADLQVGPFSVRCSEHYGSVAATVSCRAFSDNAAKAAYHLPIGCFLHSFTS